MSMDSSEHGSTSTKQRLTIGFVVSFLALCAKHASRVSKKLKPKPKEYQFSLRSDSPRFFASKSPLRSPKPKQLLTKLSNKATKLVHRKRNGDVNGRKLEVDDIGDGGVWRRSILMGDKCQPLNFSGVIYYDSKGNQVEELPNRSPRVSPMPTHDAVIRSPLF